MNRGPPPVINSRGWPRWRLRFQRPEFCVSNDKDRSGSARKRTVGFYVPARVSSRDKMAANRPQKASDPFVPVGASNRDKRP
jgi:hypothetical protein